MATLPPGQAGATVTPPPVPPAVATTGDQAAAPVLPPPPAGDLSQDRPIAPAAPVQDSPPAAATQDRAPAEPEASGAPVADAAAADAAPVEGGEIVVVGSDRRGDPLAGVNRDSYQATEAVDKAVFGPAALAYRKQVPKPFRSGVRNFVANLREPIVAANFLLQHKIGKAFETVGRFAINTTLGVAGLFDAAKKKPFHLPRRRNGFANTLGFYGVKPGPYLFLPLIGSTTVRDLFGTITDQVILPLGPVRALSNPEVAIPLGVLSALDTRAEFDDELEALRAQKRPYIALREFYLQRRQAEIDALKGLRPPPPPKTKSLDLILHPDLAEPAPTPAEPVVASPAGGGR